MSKTKLYSPRLQDSPSRQLILDLARDLEQVRLHSSELKLVRAYERKSFYENLDRLDREQEEVHNAALNAAAARRDALRREAEQTLQEHIRQQEEERERRHEAERRKKEKLEREKAEKEKKEREEKERLEAEQRAKEEEKKRQAEEAERARKAEEEERARKEQEEKNKKEEEQRAKAAAEEAERKAEEERKKAAARPAVLGASRLSPQQIAEHQRYVELHQHLKKFRKYMMEQTKTNPVLKQHMGDMRRTIKKCVGQLLTDDKVANRKPTAEISSTLKKALTLQEPSVDIRQFLAFPPPHIANAENAQVPALLIYLLNIFSKAIIAQLIAEAGVTPKYAEPLGVLTAQIFSMEPFVYNGVSMIDLLLAKYHVLCPVLWGFYGDEKTAEGKSAVGWWRESQPNGPFINAQLHEERMIGLGGGFAAISLRNFSKTSRKNPMPNSHFWTALATIVNTPADEVQDTQLIVLGAMLRYSAARVIGFWGDFGMAALRRAIVEFPEELKRKSTAAATVKVLRDIYAREQNILL